MYLGPQHRAMAVFRTVIVFAIILFVLLWIHFKTPIPPYPEGGGGPGMGLEVNLGVSDDGTGQNQLTEPINMPDFKEPQQTEPEKDEVEKLITQETEEADNIESAEKAEVKKEIKKEKPIKKPKKIKKVEKAEKTNVDEPIIPKVNQKAMFKKNNSNEGTTGKPGDQGNPNGIVGSPLYKGNGNGSGGGTGGGSGNGTGTGKGDGVSFSLEGRKSSFLSQPEFNNQSEGKVVVEITVDKNGTVINAVPGVKGSTTLDDDLLDAAKRAALKSKFDRKPDATVQKGTISYHFVLQ